MLNSRKQYLAGILLLAMLTGCLQTREAFVFDDQVNASFFKEIPEIARNVVRLKREITAVDSIHIYETGFTETLVESNNLLEYALINDSSKANTVKYKNIDGYSQHLYLIHLITKPRNENAFVYFTVKYDQDEQCIGFGPSYYGYLNASRNLIKFSAALKIVKNETAYQLSETNTPASMLFIARSIKPRSPINIEKIVNDQHNKIGGPKALIYTVKEIFKDTTALQFYYVKSLKL